MLIALTDAVSKKSIFVNPKLTVAVFEIVEGDLLGKTGISLMNGGLVVEESVAEVVGLIQGELSN